MENRCPKCNRDLVRASVDGTDGKTLAGSFLDCAFCGAATLNTEANDTLLFELATPHEQIAHFRLEKLLGSGGFGDVWLASDTKLNRAVALKLSKSKRRETSTLVFEAQTAASLKHPNIVSVHEVGDVNGQVYIASDLIEGMTLADFLSSGKPQLGRTIEIMIPIARALNFAHTRGVYHRDIKPANILLDHSGQPYVTDFGLAKRTSDTSSSSNGRMVGTVRYMSPEQAIGNFGETNGRSDIYSLGVTLFEMLTGETPFRGNAQAILHQKAFDDAPSPRLLEPGIPKDLETICLKCLEREPSKRFQSADELADELGRYAADEPIRSRPISRFERTWRWCQKRPAISGLVAGLFLSLTFGLIGVSYFWRSSVSHENAVLRSLYRSWMNMASIHLQTGDTSGVRNALSKVSTDPDLAKLRGFEWSFFNKLLEPIVQVGTLGTPIVDVAVTNDGDYCAATGGENEIRVWNVKAGGSAQILTADTPGFQAIDFSPTTAQLAAGASDGFVRVYDPLTSARMIRQFLHGPSVKHVSYSPDGRLLASSGSAGAVRIWDATDANLLAEIPTGKKTATTVALRFSPDSNQLFIASSDGRVRTWDTKAFRTLSGGEIPLPVADHNMAISPLTSLAVSDDGKTLYAGSYLGITSTLSLEDGIPSTLKTRWGPTVGMEPVTNTNLLAIATNDGLLHLLERSTQKELRSIHSHGVAEATLCRSPNGKVFVIGSGDGSVSVIKIAELVRPNIFWHPNEQPVRSVKFLGSAEKLLAAYQNGDLLLWNTDDGTYQKLIDGAQSGERLVDVHPSMDFFVTGSDNSVEIWDLKSLKSMDELSGESLGVKGIRFSKSGALFAIAFRSGRVRVYQSSEWSKPLLEINRPQSSVVAIEFTPDETALAIASSEATLDLIDIKSGDSRHSTSVVIEPSSMTYCPDSNEFAIGTTTGEILFWNAYAKQPGVSIKAHSGRIHEMVVVPGGRTLITGGRDKTLEFWDLPSKELNTALTDHTRQIFSIAVTPDGRTVASGSLEGDVRIWRSQ